MTFPKIVPLFIVGGLVATACGSPKKAPPTTPANATPPAASGDPEPIPPHSASAASASAAPEPAKTDTKQADCDALVEDASSSLDAKRIEFAEKACKKDADCVAIKGHACNFACVNGAVPKTQEKAWNDAVTKVKDTQCKKWTDNACDKLSSKPPPTCQDRKVTCDKGRCAAK